MNTSETVKEISAAIDEKWSRVSTPPKKALKEIVGGRLKGMTDINPQWRYQAMTEVYGLCGIGWRYSIEKTWTEQYNNEVCVFAEVWLYIDIEGTWSEPIPGIGGSRIVTTERSGQHVSDEGYKMAVTDALSVAMKMIGVGSDIYMGLWDGSKYKDDDPDKPQNKSGSRTPVGTPPQSTADTLAQVAFVKQVAYEIGLGAEEVALNIMKKWSTFTGKKDKKVYSLNGWDALEKSGNAWIDMVYKRAQEENAKLPDPVVDDNKAFA